MIFNMIALMIGILILGAGIFYFFKEKADTESRKIYGIAILAGLAVTIFAVVRLILVS
ncbi:MAG: hypothetical protein J6D08_15325 [Lachnospiraceae bacterium]|nr:hypothetical protein [Lachnospiraceae bacterium]